MALVQCPDCGGEVSSRAAACPRCGGPIAGAPPARAPAGSPLGRTPAAGAGTLPLDLFTVGGMSSLAIDRAVTLGRSKANLLVEHQDVAPTHCRLEPRGEAWFIEDLSGEGVYAGAVRVCTTWLRAGEVVDVGGFPGAVSLALPCALGSPIPLLLTAPGGRQTSLVLQKLPMVMGRGSWVDLPLGDRNVSHAHARLRLENGRVVLDDLQSRNGTFVGGARVKAGHALRLGDRLKLGETELVFGEAAPVEPEAPAPADGGEVVIPGGLTVEQLAGPADRDAHVPAAKAVRTDERALDASACPSCGGSLELRRGGVITGAWRLARTAVGLVGGSGTRSEVGRCSSCGARLAMCPVCGVANAATSLLERLACRRCDEEFTAG